MASPTSNTKYKEWEQGAETVSEKSDSVLSISPHLRELCDDPALTPYKKRAVDGDTLIIDSKKKGDFFIVTRNPELDKWSVRALSNGTTGKDLSNVGQKELIQHLVKIEQQLILLRPGQLLQSTKGKIITILLDRNHPANRNEVVRWDGHLQIGLNNGKSICAEFNNDGKCNLSITRGKTSLVSYKAIAPSDVVYLTWDLNDEKDTNVESDSPYVEFPPIYQSKLKVTSAEVPKLDNKIDPRETLEFTVSSSLKNEVYIFWNEPPKEMNPHSIIGTVTFSGNGEIKEKVEFGEFLATMKAASTGSSDNYAFLYPITKIFNEFFKRKVDDGPTINVSVSLGIVDKWGKGFPLSSKEITYEHGEYNTPFRD